MTSGKGNKPDEKPVAAKYKPRKEIEILANPDDVDAAGRALAENTTSGSFAALRIIRASERSAGYEADLDVPGMIATLRAQGEAVSAGNLAYVEAMLMNQATALQTAFARLVERGMGCVEIPAFEMNLRMGLRAQAQCRATLETLANIKNPPAVFARQANVTTGPQQINNGMAVPSRPRENEVEPNKLSGAGNELLADTRTSAFAGGTDSQVDAVAALDRPEIGGR